MFQRENLKARKSLKHMTLGAIIKDHEGLYDIFKHWDCLHFYCFIIVDKVPTIPTEG